MDKADIGLADLVDVLHRELNKAVAAAAKHEVQFPVAGVEVEVHVGVTREVGTNAGVRLWVVELGAEGRASAESVQRITLKLDPPLDKHGHRVTVSQRSSAPPPPGIADDSD